MTRPITLVLTALAVFAASCGDGSTVGTSTSPSTTGAVTTSTSDPPGTTATSFTTTSSTTTSSTTTRPPSTADPIMIEVGGVSHEIPGDVCVDGGLDAAAVRSAADESAHMVERLTSQRVSGWPTTTIAFEDTYPQRVLGPAVRALALASLGGFTDEVVARWQAFEQSYADASLGYPAISEISYRLSEWQAAGAPVASAVAEECAGRP